MTSLLQVKVVIVSHRLWYLSGTLLVSSRKYVEHEQVGLAVVIVIIISSSSHIFRHFVREVLAELSRKTASKCLLCFLPASVRLLEDLLDWH